MGEVKTKSFPFVNKGLSQTIDPALISGGQYMALLNFTTVQEGGLITRSGRKYLGHLPLDTLPHTIRKMVISKDTEVPGSPSVNPRYIGAADNIYRTGGSADTSGGAPFSTSSLGDPANQVATGVANIADYTTKRWNMAEFNMGASGKPWAFFSCPNSMLKDSGETPYATLRQWGILPAWGVAQAIDGGSGNLDGGDTDSPAGSTVYDWVYCYADDSGTGNKGNPSQVMIADPTTTSPPLALHNRKASVTVYGTDDPQVDNIWIFRRGGTWTDNVWRAVGRVPNPGVDGGTGVPNSATFVDNQSDAILTSAEQAEFDNDPPVLSNAPRLVNTTLRSPSVGPGWATISLNQNLALTKITRGSTLRFQGYTATQSTNNAEDVVIALVSGFSAVVYLQYNHAVNEVVTCDAVTAQPCYGTVSAFDSVFVYGDPLNPHILYKSKNSLPESMPLRQADGVVNAIAVGTPDNGIQAAAEFRGTLTCLNVKGIYQVLVYQGVMIGPQATPASRGLYSRYAWCKGDNVIYYLAYDGIYAWDGTQAVNLSAEQIDGIFHGLLVNNIQPLDLNPVNAQFCRMVYERGTVLFLYRDVQGNTQRLRYNIAEKRWLPEQDAKEASATGEVTEMYLEEDTGNVIFGRFDAGGGAFSVDDQVAYLGTIENASDEFSDTFAENGDPIIFLARTGWFDMGNRILRKNLQELILECDPKNAITINVYYDYASSPGDSLTIPASNSGRQWISLLESLSGSGVFYGKECFVVSFEFRNDSPANKTRTSLWSLSFKYEELGEVTAGAVGIWNDLGADTDKRLYQCTIEFDTRGVNRTLNLDAVRGVDGNVTAIAATQFILSNPIILGNGRAKKVFPMPDAFFAKAVRLSYLNTQSSVVPAGPPFFIVYKVEWLKEILPPDVVSFTPWEQNENQMYGQEVYIEVDTNGQAVSVQVQTDGNTVTPVRTLTVIGTSENRRSRYTLPPNSLGFSWRLYMDPGSLINVTGTCDVSGINLSSGTALFTAAMAGMTILINGLRAEILSVTDSTHAILKSGTLGVISGAAVTIQGKFQLYSHKFTLTENQPGPIGHTYDFDYLGYPYPKKLQLITFEYDCEGGTRPAIDMDILKEDGITLIPKKQQFNLSSIGRGKQTFVITDDTYAVAVRIYPDPSNLDVQFREWKYNVQKIDYPPIIAPTTEWDDLGYPCEKIARSMSIEVNTNGVQATAFVDIDGQNTPVQFPINTTINDRTRIVTFPPNIIGRRFRLRNTPGAGGWFQLFKYSFEAIREPCPLTIWRSYEQNLGYPGFKFIRQIWIQYYCLGQITLNIYRDGGTLFFTTLLPAHAVRDIERFFLPAKVGAAFNKSKQYIFELLASDQSKPFKLYPASTAVEFIAIGTQQRVEKQLIDQNIPIGQPPAAVAG